MRPSLSISSDRRKTLGRPSASNPPEAPTAATSTGSMKRTLQISEIFPLVAVSIEQHGGLFSQHPGHQLEHDRVTRGFNQVMDTLSSRHLVHSFQEILLADVDGGPSELTGQFQVLGAQITDHDKSVKAPDLAKILEEQEARRPGPANQDIPNSLGSIKGVSAMRPFGKIAGMKNTGERLNQRRLRSRQRILQLDAVYCRQRQIFRHGALQPGDSVFLIELTLV